MSLTYLDSEWGYTHGEVAEHVPSVLDSDWGVAHATVATPGRPTLQRGGSEVAPAWSVIKAGVEVPVVSWHAIKAGIEVPLATSMGPAWTPPTYVVGAGPVGSTHYPIPTEDVIYMAPGGSDAAAGTLAAPKATLAAALAAVPDGGTIVIRGGTYHDGHVEAGERHNVTVQSYPGEAVWFDGTIPYTPTWTSNNGNGTWTAPYSLTLDRMLGKSAAGLAVFSGAANRVITDQVWVDGVRLAAVADRTTPGAGQFSVDQTADTLTIGTNPTGKQVRIADLRYLMAGAGLRVRGIGIRRYVQAMLEWRGSALTLDRSHVEELTVEHCSVNGISVGGAGATIRKCTVQDVGLMGMGSGDSSNGLIELNLVRRTNRGGFDPEPVTAGLKVFRVLEGLTIRFNHFEDVANGSAIWLDTSVNRSYIIGNTVNGDSALGTAGRCKTGIEIEGSDGGYYDGVQHYSYVVGNRVSNCRQGGFLVFDSGYIKAWNNSFSAAVAVWLWQDYRHNTGAKPLEGTAEQTPWHTEHVHLVNNALVPEDAFKTQLRAQCNADAPFKIAGGAMLSRLSTNWFRPQGTGLMAYLSDANGSSWSIRSTLESLATTAATYGGPLAPIMDGNYQGTTPPPAGYETPIEADVAAAAGIPAGYEAGIGPIWPPLVLAEDVFAPLPAPAPSTYPVGDREMPSVVFDPTMWAYRPLPDDSPVDQHSAARIDATLQIARDPQYHGNPDNPMLTIEYGKYSVGLVRVLSGDPTLTITSKDGDTFLNNMFAGIQNSAKDWGDTQWAGPERALIPVPTGTDMNTTMLNQQTNEIADIWQLVETATPNTYTVSQAGRKSGVSEWDARYNGMLIGRGNAACGISPAAYAVRFHELLGSAGLLPCGCPRIPHVLGWALPDLYGGVHDGTNWTERRFSYPAVRTDGRNSTDPNARLWMGQMVRLPRSADVHALSNRPVQRILLHAIQDYGMIVTDTSGAVQLVVGNPDGTTHQAELEAKYGIPAGELWKQTAFFPFSSLVALPIDYQVP